MSVRPRLKTTVGNVSDEESVPYRLKASSPNKEMPFFWGGAFGKASLLILSVAGDVAGASGRRAAVNVVCGCVGMPTTSKHPLCSKTKIEGKIGERASRNH